MISVPLDVDGSQISTEGVVSLEKELCDFAVEELIAVSLRLSAHSSGKVVEVVALFDDGRSVEPVAQSDGSSRLTVLVDESVIWNVIVNFGFCDC